MIPTREHRMVAGAALLLAISLPLLAAAIRDPRPPSCDLDGVEIDPLHAVEAKIESGRTLVFCCVGCAERWLSLSDATVRAVRVTDELRGLRIGIREAWFVRSPLVTTPETGNRIRSFGSREDARAHVREHGGHLLDGAERPFVELARRPARAADDG